MKSECARCVELGAQVTESLERISGLTKAQVAAFKALDGRNFLELDKELERAVGLKERRIGAYREHQVTHGEEHYEPIETIRR